MKRGQRPPGSKAWPKPYITPLPVYWIELNVLAPIASTAAASEFACCACAGIDTARVNPTITAHCMRMVGPFRKCDR